MKIGVLGTGDVGTTLGSKLIETGHSVMIGSRSANNEKGNAFAAEHKGMGLSGTMAESAAYGEIVLNCTHGTGSLDSLKLAGEKNLEGKIIIDVANALDFTNGVPSLAIRNTSSLGEEIQKTFPKSHVVKAFNTISAPIMVNPKMINGGDHNLFICGNDDASKDKVREIIKSFGWREENIVDLGDITGARATEMYLQFWIRILTTGKDWAFNIKIVK